MATKKKKLSTLTEKYRENDIHKIIDVNGQVKRIIGILQKRVKRHFLLVGPAGTGKTTAAYAIAFKFIELNQSKASAMQMSNPLDAIEYINASKEGIDAVRKKVQPLVDIGGINVIILDEFDGISKSAQHALRSIMEEAEQKASPKLIILTGNYVNKIIDPIISRCGGEAFYFNKIPIEMMKPKLVKICRLEGVNQFKHKPETISKEDRSKEFNDYIESLYNKVNGDMREALKFIEVHIEETETGKSLDLTISFIDLATNALHIQLDGILLDEKLSSYSDEHTDYSKLLDSIDELMYKKDNTGAIWEAQDFINETFNWLKLRNERFSYLTCLKFASIIGKFEDRLHRGNNIQTQISAMIAELHLTSLKTVLENKIQR